MFIKSAFNVMPSSFCLTLGLRWSETYQSEDIMFHYVSGSPWQLQQLLSQFLNETSGFPHGSYHLRFWRLKGREAFSVLGSPYKFKTKILEPMLSLLAGRRFILGTTTFFFGCVDPF